jgi:hypothetical protein
VADGRSGGIGLLRIRNQEGSPVGVSRYPLGTPPCGLNSTQLHSLVTVVTGDKRLASKLALLEELVRRVRDQVAIEAGSEEEPAARRVAQAERTGKKVLGRTDTSLP